MPPKIRYNKIIDLLEQGKPVFAAGVVGNGNLDELTFIADSDYDAVIIETEHEGFSFHTLRVSLQFLLNRLLMGIVEEAEGVKNIRDILRQVKGIGAIWAGPGDLSISMGLRGDTKHPQVQEALLQVLAAGKEFGVPCAVGAAADEVAMRLEQGFHIIIAAPMKTTPVLDTGRRLAGR